MEDNNDYLNTNSQMNSSPFNSKLKSKYKKFYKKNESNDQIKFECQIDNCFWSMKSDIPSNFGRHLKRAHHDIFDQLENEKPNKKQMKIDEMFSGKTRTRQEIFEEKLSFCLSTGPFSLNCIKHDEFIDLIKFVDESKSQSSKLTFPSRYKAEITIDEIFENMKKTMIKSLKSAKKIVLSIDIWSKKGLSSSYLGVLATYFDRIDHSKKIIVLGLRQIEGTHTGENINNLLIKVINEFEISTDKIWKVGIDNGANMIRAIDLFNEELIKEYEYLENEWDKCEYKIDHLDFTSLPCFIHTLMLCIKIVEKDKYFKDLIELIKKIASRCNSSTKITQVI